MVTAVLEPILHRLRSANNVCRGRPRGSDPYASLRKSFALHRSPDTMRRYRFPTPISCSSFAGSAFSATLAPS